MTIQLMDKIKQIIDYNDYPFHFAKQLEDEKIEINNDNLKQARNNCFDAIEMFFIKAFQDPDLPIVIKQAATNFLQIWHDYCDLLSCPPDENKPAHLKAILLADEAFNELVALYKQTYVERFHFREELTISMAVIAILTVSNIGILSFSIINPLSAVLTAVSLDCLFTGGTCSGYMRGLHNLSNSIIEEVEELCQLRFNLAQFGAAILKNNLLVQSIKIKNGEIRTKTKDVTNLGLFQRPVSQVKNANSRLRPSKLLPQDLLETYESRCDDPNTEATQLLPSR